MPSQPTSGIEPGTFVAVVTEIRELMRVHGRPVFQLALNRSKFTAGTGSETEPLGTLTATSRSGAVLIAPITAVTHDPSGEQWHTTTKPLQPGTVVSGSVDRD